MTLTASTATISACPPAPGAHPQGVAHFRPPAHGSRWDASRPPLTGVCGPSGSCAIARPRLPSRQALGMRGVLPAGPTLRSFDGRRPPPPNAFTTRGVAESQVCSPGYQCQRATHASAKQQDKDGHSLPEDQRRKRYEPDSHSSNHGATDDGQAGVGGQASRGTAVGACDSGPADAWPGVVGGGAPGDLAPSFGNGGKVTGVVSQRNEKLGSCC
jgi:hypothetical protein